MRATTLLLPICFVAVAGAAGFSAAAPAGVVEVAQPAWDKLSEAERVDISSRYVVQIYPVDAAGTITDVQVADESSPGTGGAGAQIGALTGSAVYADRSISAGNYSATRDLSTALIGALIGSLADRGREPQFRARYTIRMLDGQIQYQDRVMPEPFRHSVGVCVSVANVTPIDQDVCRQTPEQLRDKYVKQP